MEEVVIELSAFIKHVGDFRQSWGLPNHKELWFRGESRDYKETILRPALYRPAPASVDELPKALKPIKKLLSIENGLHDEFKRAAIERCEKPISESDWDWDSYFLMQHHNGPTRLLDWSDGALMALHFALRNKEDDAHDARVYVLESYRLSKAIKRLPDIEIHKQKWKKYVKKHPCYGLDKHHWDDGYLPGTKKVFAGMPLPAPPLVLDFPHLNRRSAAQRSRFIVFGTDPSWLHNEFQKTDSLIKRITIAKTARSKIRQELRDCGITESVIYPDLDGLGREMGQIWEDRRAAAEENS